MSPSGSTLHTPIPRGRNEPRPLGCGFFRERIADSARRGARRRGGRQPSAAWVGVRRRCADRHPCAHAELGMLDYTPTPADPYNLNATLVPPDRRRPVGMLSRVLCLMIGGHVTKVIGVPRAAPGRPVRHINPPTSRLVPRGVGRRQTTSLARPLVPRLTRPGRTPALPTSATSPRRGTVQLSVNRSRRVPEALRRAAPSAGPAGDGPAEHRDDGGSGRGSGGPAGRPPRVRTRARPMHEGAGPLSAATTPSASSLLGD